MVQWFLSPKRWKETILLEIHPLFTSIGSQGGRVTNRRQVWCLWAPRCHQSHLRGCDQWQAPRKTKGLRYCKTKAAREHGNFEDAFPYWKWGIFHCYVCLSGWYKLFFIILINITVIICMGQWEYPCFPWRRRRIMMEFTSYSPRGVGVTQS